MALAIKGQYIWDFWYTYDAVLRMFTVYFLHADRTFVQEDQHHFHSAVGVCKTINWVDFFDYRLNVLRADQQGWANTSIWTGDAIPYGSRKAIFYTSRDRSAATDGMTQSIGLAYANEDNRIEVTPVRIDAYKGYLLESDPLEDSIHCWRDPFLFEMDHEVYMLVAAKREDHPVNHRGCIALLKLTDKDDLSSWKHLGMIVSTSYSEVELPQIYQAENGKLRIFFNAHSANGSHFVMTDPFIFDEAQPNAYVDRDICPDFFEHVKYYGFRIIPEQNFAVCGFSRALGCVQIVGNLGFLSGLRSIKPVF